jgi:tetratricopeptide (TPR) repeat protein
MQAAISGIARKAVIVDGESVKLFDVDNPAQHLDCSRADIPYIFGEGLDLRFVADTSIESVRAELKSESNFRLALDLTLISFDSELEEDIRQDAIRDLDGLIRDEETSDRLEGVMYARPLPEDAELEWVLRQDLAAPNASEFFKTLGLRQSLISDVSAAWDLIPSKVFGGDEQKLDFQRVAVQQGLFRTLVTLLEMGSNISQFLLTAGLDAAITKLRNSREVLQQWAAPFREASQTLVVTPDMVEELRGERAPRRKRGRLIGLDRPARLRQVNEKKAIISAAIKRRDLDFVRERVDDLVNFQRKSESEYLAKSLCDLAMEAKELGMFDLQMELTERSVGEVPDDAWSWAQYGDALLKMGKFDNALYAFKQSEDFGESLVAKTGRALVLKAQGELPAALAAYEEVIRLHPENAVAKAGRAEVLKAQGKLPAALSAYEEVIRLHPEDVFAQTGRAEVLKAQGELPAALAAYEEVIRLHPENAVAKTGRAEVLKAQGKLPAALAAYEEVIKLHPEDVVVQSGRAEVLKAQGELPAALAAYEEVIRLHPENAVAKNGRAEVLKAQGELPAALAAYEEVIRLHPEDVVAQTGRAEVLKAQGELPAALAAYEEVIRQHPENAVAKNGRAEVLKAQGELPAALAAYEEVIRLHPENAVAKNGRAEVFKAQGELPAALAAYEDVIRLHPENVVAKNGRAEVFKAQGELPAALAAYEEVIRLHPEDAVARNGRSSVLAALGRFDDALKSLPHEIPATLQDWIGYHTRGVILLKMKDRNEAIRILSEGLQHCSWQGQKEYFRATLVVAWLGRGDIKKAKKDLEQIKSADLQPAANVLRLHVFGADGDLENASLAYESLKPTPLLFRNELTTELRRRFILRQQSCHSDEWISEREADLFLLAA